MSFKKRFFTIPFPLLFGSAAIYTEYYANLPLESIHKSSPTPLVGPRNGDSLFIVFPGSGGPDEFTELLLKNVKSADAALQIPRYSCVYDWLNWRGNFFRAAYDGDTVGKLIGKQVADEEKKYGKLRSIQTVGISVGAFAADAFIRSYQAQSKQLHTVSPAHTHLTLLDPFESKGVFRGWYGYQSFGETADYCEEFLNTDDPVPFTATHLQYAYSYDVTKSEKRQKFNLPSGTTMHCWPVAYLANNWKTEVDKQGKLLLPVHTRDRPRGGRVRVK
eukprot:CAMPEP_0182416756 /NCGR_PEP_ID=MMETSP1167-20130531/1112_1 /TAXON_ID=2988 /ORGANISM="Mallomonas Sp, Strain CCMP3275" /LENGTH=274 /DNA_ID=CAMNT_0024589797 /DNA_START=243 /DNA_END=1064 /DNA_ORIENTATION=-